jgi:hypothetical protein
LLFVSYVAQLPQSGYRIGRIPVAGLCHRLDDVGYLAAIVGKLHCERWHMVDLGCVRSRHQVPVEVQDVGRYRLNSLGQVLKGAARNALYDPGISTSRSERRLEIDSLNHLESLRNFNNIQDDLEQRVAGLGYLISFHYYLRLWLSYLRSHRRLYDGLFPCYRLVPSFRGGFSCLRRCCGARI